VEFRIADTFVQSLGRLTADEQKAAKTTVFDLQVNPAGDGRKFHRIERTVGKGFWSVRASQDLRLIVHRDGQSLLLCFVGHHDDAYRWAERRRLDVHPATGAAQLVEVAERVEEVVVRRVVETVEPALAPPSLPLLAGVEAETLLAYGVPEAWISALLAASADDLLAYADHLPREAAEAVLDLATGTTPPLPASGSDPFLHPDAQRRFRTIQDVDELERALDHPWEQWTVFLHPAQRQSVERVYRGPARISGSAGTGKTIVALHRAVHLVASDESTRVLLTTFSTPLARALKAKLRVLVGARPGLAERLDVVALDALARRLQRSLVPAVRMASPDEVYQRLDAASGAVSHTFSRAFIRAEWDEIVDAWGLQSWEDYRDVPRLGRKTRLPVAQRETFWRIAELVQASLRTDGLVTLAGLYQRLADAQHARASPLYDYVVVDEAQDVSIPQLRFLAALGSASPDALFFTGDLGQRIFQQPFSWKRLGVDVRGRAHTLRVNYRTSHQIRRHADRLLGDEMQDLDGNVESRRGVQSVFNGPEPVLRACKTPQEETGFVANWLKSLAAQGVLPDEIGLIVRSEELVPRAVAAAETANLRASVLDQQVEVVPGTVSIATMPLAKGLEFRAVGVMACDEDVLPLQSRVEKVADIADLEDVYDTERHLLYVACTRARDALVLTSGGTPSEFFGDL